MEVDWPSTSRLRVDVHLPGLAERVGLNEVTLIVHVEPVLGGVLLEIGYESGDVD
jgi:hypothetical protein